MNHTQLPKNDFVREQIKSKPKNRKRLFVKLCEAFLCGIMFSLAACLVVLLLWPKLENHFQVGGNTQGGSSGSEPLSQTEFVTEPDTETQADTTTPEPTETTTEEQHTVVEISKELTLSDYQRLTNELYAIGARGNKSIVTITSVVSDTDWFNNSYERVGQGCGTIIGETEKEYLILTERKLIKDASEIRVTFIDDAVVKAKLFRYDGNTGIALVTVAKEEMEPATKNRISVIEFGTAGKIYRGALVIALGSPLGTNYSILTGTISATNSELSLWDSNYAVFTTDIAANKNSSGILVDTDGRLIGLVMQQFSSSQATTLTALPIAELKPVIDLLFANKEIPYVGLHVSTVTDRIAATYQLPKGVYIKEVALDSPAMNAGLQSGDVVTLVGNANVTTDTAYRTAVLSLTPGEEYPIVVQRFSNDGYQEIRCVVTPEVLH